MRTNCPSFFPGFSERSDELSEERIAELLDETRSHYNDIGLGEKGETTKVVVTEEVFREELFHITVNSQGKVTGVRIVRYILMESKVL